MICLVVVAAAVTACSAILGIHEPDVAALQVSDRDGAVPEIISPGGDGGVDAALVFDAATFDSGCPQNRADCNNDASDGCEVDTTTPANCGSCGHACLACESGQCAPQTIASGGALDYAGFVAVDGQNLYWASAGSTGLYVVAKGGGGTPVAKATANPFDATTVSTGSKYVAATVYSSAEGVRAYDAVTGNPVTGIQVDACNAALGFVADETGAIYYAHGSESGVCAVAPMHITKRVPNGGGFSEEWDFAAGAFRAGESQWMTLDAQFLYYVGYRDTVPGIYRISRAGGASAIVAPGQYNSAPLASGGSLLYTIYNNDEGLLGPASVVAIDKNTGVATGLASGERSFSLTPTTLFKASLAVDAKHVYWTADDGVEAATGKRLARIMRVPKAGGAKELLAGKQASGYGMAIDDGFVYWTTTSAIKRIPK